MKRIHQILIAILAVQVVLAVIVLWPRSAATGESQPLFADLKTDDVVSLSITDAEGQSITVRKQAGEWVLPEADDFPADVQKITPVLEDIAALNTDRLVTRTAASHQQLQVATNDFQRRVEIAMADGTTHAFYLGSSPSYGATHFRRSDQNETYLTDALTVWDVYATPASWINTSYVSIAIEEITGLTLANKNGTFVFTKDDAGNWTMQGLAAGETADSTKITAVVRQAASVVISRPLGQDSQPSYGMDQPSAVATMQTAEKTVTLTVGSQDPDDKSWVVKSSESPYYVSVSSYSGEQLTAKTHADFLKVEPTPTPTPAS
jgi:YD repeat-containing protein